MRFQRFGIVFGWLILALASCAPSQPMPSGRAPEIVQPYTGIQVGTSTADQVFGRLGNPDLRQNSFKLSGVVFYSYSNRGDRLRLQEKNGRIVAEFREPAVFSPQATLWYYRNLWADTRTEFRPYVGSSHVHGSHLRVFVAPDLGVGAVYDPSTDRVIEVIRYE
ncbi:MAG: hypothetical protein JNL01_06150 [Bdellovibrionales bacterium]|nr:hypothetical protein [Bdellovibrionales bacterium]